MGWLLILVWIAFGKQGIVAGKTRGCGRHGGYIGESLQRCAICCVESVCCETEGFCAGKRVFLSSCCGFLLLHVSPGDEDLFSVVLTVMAETRGDLCWE